MLRTAAGVFYPSARDAFGEMPPRQQRPRYLSLVRSMGFDGVEVGVEEDADATSAQDLAREMADAGLSILSRARVARCTIRWPGRRANDWTRICYAAWLGAGLVNTALVSPPTDPRGPGAARQGEPVSQGASRTATEHDFGRTAEYLRDAAARAADSGVTIAIEVHQGSIADNSQATLHLLDLTGHPNVGANPDLGNIYWHYDVPDETAEGAISALAPRAVYWHCKNLRRIHLPDLRRSVFQRVPLPDGDLDYRFAIAAMLAAGYQGPLAVEGGMLGDQLSQDRRSVEYVRQILDDLAPD